MKKNQKQTIYKFPEEIAKEYWLLMNSKTDFLRNHKTVGSSELKTLYVELESAWNQNHLQNQSYILIQIMRNLKDSIKSKNLKNI
jgi:hypothetical protein